MENQVGLVRERFFTPTLRAKSLEDLNGLLLDKCVAYAKAHKHPELADQTIWQAFEAGRNRLVPVPKQSFPKVATGFGIKTLLKQRDISRFRWPGQWNLLSRFNGFHAITASVSKTTATSSRQATTAGASKTASDLPHPIT